MKKKKYKIIRNNRHIYAVKELGNKGYWNNKVKRLLKIRKNRGIGYDKGNHKGWQDHRWNE